MTTHRYLYKGTVSLLFVLTAVAGFAQSAAKLPADLDPKSAPVVELSKDGHVCAILPLLEEHADYLDQQHGRCCYLERTGCV